MPINLLGNWLSVDAQIRSICSSARVAICLDRYTVKLRPSGAMRLRKHGHGFELPTIVCSLF